MNEVLFGWQSSPNDFFGNSSPDMFTNQDGYFLTFGFPVSRTTCALTNPAPGNSNNPQPRNTPNFNFDNNLNWLKGNHSFKFGGSFTRISNTHHQLDDGAADQPRASTRRTIRRRDLFNTTNFPGASTNNLNNARALYALLTGRVSSVAGTGRLNDDGTEYIYNGRLTQAERMDEFGFYVSDSWRVKPNMTLSMGLRYEAAAADGPDQEHADDDDARDRLRTVGLRRRPRRPAVQPVQSRRVQQPEHVPTYTAYSAETTGYNTDLNNFAPVVGITYRPTVTDGFWRKFLGDPEQAVLSSGFTRSFNRERIDRFTAVFGSNPGSTTPATRNTAATGFPLVPAGETWPLLFSQKNRLGPPDFQKTPIVPDRRGDQQRRPRSSTPTSRCRTPTPGRSASSAR